MHLLKVILALFDIDGLMESAKSSSNKTADELIPDDTVLFIKQDTLRKYKLIVAEATTNSKIFLGKC